MFFLFCSVCVGECSTSGDVLCTWARKIFTVAPCTTPTPTIYPTPQTHKSICHFAKRGDDVWCARARRFMFESTHIVHMLIRFSYAISNANVVEHFKIKHRNNSSSGGSVVMHVDAESAAFNICALRARSR